VADLGGSCLTRFHRRVPSQAVRRWTAPGCTRGQSGAPPHLLFHARPSAIRRLQSQWSELNSAPMPGKPDLRVPDERRFATVAVCWPVAGLLWRPQPWWCPLRRSRPARGPNVLGLGTKPRFCREARLIESVKHEEAECWPPLVGFAVNGCETIPKSTFGLGARCLIALQTTEGQLWSGVT